jgi:hypothetical protein
LTQNAGTACLQGTVGTASADLILNTVSITSGSTVSITRSRSRCPKVVDVDELDQRCSLG